GRPPAAVPGLAMPAPAAGMAPVDGPGEAWPTGGVGGPMRSLLGMLVHGMSEAGGPALRVVSAQPWTADMARALRAAVSAQGGPAALQTWRVGQGSVQAEDGERGFAFTLQVPSAWAARGAAAGAGSGMAASTGAQALAIPFPGRQARLEPGVFALVLQPAGDDAGATGRTSALLSLEFQPPPQQGLYGREWMQPALRPDPWLQMAALQASGWRREDEEAEAAARRGAVPPCDQPGCPYEGRAPCEQPFCLALRVQAPRHPA
ncbi:Fe-S oxidoreductase, partial [Paracidovorax avenae]|uniref:Fe-S oxidoreductase n=1 Tax=Paracidovorax avenae TaxID=80867 RepID=UPI000D20C742